MKKRKPIRKARNQKVLTSLTREQLVELVGRSEYVSLEFIAGFAEKKYYPSRKDTLRRYLSELKRTGAIFGAGRGWYSRLSEPAVLDPKPVDPLVRSLKAQFPLLDFSCWALEQLNPFAQHLFAKQIYFLAVDEAGLEAVAEYLEAQSYLVHVKPGKADARKISLKDRTVILRPTLKLANNSFKGFRAPVEKVVVDLYFEIEKLGLIDRSEYQAILKNLFENKRVSASRLIYYIRQREKTVREVLGPASSLFSGYLKNPDKRDSTL